MTPFKPRPRHRALIPLLVTVIGLALGVIGLAVLRPFGRPNSARPGSASAGQGGAAGQGGGPALSPKAVYARVEPSVVDVTATLRYDGETASGTGFAVNPRAGLVLTNNHVVRDATTVNVTIPGTGQVYPATIVGVDVGADIAVLRIGPVPGLAQAPIGDSAAMSVGAPVVAVGNQSGADGSPALAPGLISGTGESIQAADGVSGFTETLHGMLATTAKIEPGDSGGPLANAAGAVIGIDTAAGIDGAAPGYAIPINTAMTVERRIVAGQSGQGITLGTHGFLGVVTGLANSPRPRARAARGGRERRQTATVLTDARPSAGCLATKAAARVPALAAPARSGVLVDGVLCGTAAAAAGIAAGDVIVRADGQQVSSPDTLNAIVSDCKPGSVVAVTWIGLGGVRRTSRVRLNPAPAA